MDDLIDDGPAPRGRNEAEYTVSEISGAVKRTLEGTFGRIRVRGEVGRIFRARSGHLYYDVKDDRNVLACTTWKGQISSLSVQPEEGMEVIVTGRLSGFGAQSKYNLNVDAMEVAGAGALMAMLEKRRTQLAAEGLFEASRKVPLPFLPNVIGVVTSPQGAVIRDILHRLSDRFPRNVLIWPVAVQGRACAPEVANAIRGFNALPPNGPIPRPDLLIVARGGGSIEDLWGFNEEAVVRATADSRIPLISAVGHETDTTLIDFASDHRAPTPTAAAERAVPVRSELIATVRALGQRQTRAADALVRARRQRLADLSRGLPRPEVLVQRPRTRVEALAGRLPLALTARVARARAEIAQLDRGLTLGERLGAARQRLSLLSGRLDLALQAQRRRDAARVSATAGAFDRLAARGFPQPRRDLDRLVRRLTPEALSRRALRDGDRLEAILRRLSVVATTRQSALTARLTALDRLRESLGYERTLERGFAVVWAGDRVVTDPAAARAARQVSLQFAGDGRVDAVTAGGTAPSRKRVAGAKDDDQGQLF
ncbi:exodeoxyribonuclease 7 large subunit [Jannaschia pagri]|uniref:Exodeoxyribonuclease 7 large subunit n=1 Tax=Jannaschia pagri TaxID=2829797 RepID=A0ABQ4NKF0_9RHOB|nr:MULTISPECIES: exodeoxyribonuclease VII large subunit [unclassified Jannaschia]GIT90879.1 exodeoxyribonuclease 7 large subunit [Jannaschia sp. AI_61]GIT94710.1 exodeoxyribonuclease 7 large subunit [Jannaschia sp. AI_62]